MKTNFLLNTDSYKCSHYLQYPPRTENVYSYIESRGGEFPSTLFFGLQGFLKEYLSEPFTMEDIDEAEEIITEHGLPFNKGKWIDLLCDYDGFLPLTIKAVKEGSVIPTSNVLLTVEATNEKFFWLTSYLETSLLRAIWYPTTVATLSWNIKQIFKKYLEETGTPELLPFKLHDFGARGVSSFESSQIGGAAHLVNFMGTDTLSALSYLKKNYGAKSIAGFSIPAAEHVSIISWGKENEVLAYKNMLDQFAKPGSLVAIVSDSYDILAACDIFGTTLKQQIIDSGATVIIRPDSGEPKKVVIEVLERLGSHFGTTENSKGFKVLNHNVRVIQGDGITINSIPGILEACKEEGWSLDNLALGMGGGLLQQVNRDTFSFAMKASAVKINGQWNDVFKDPVGDKGKVSKRGKLNLWKTNGINDFFTRREEQIYDQRYFTPLLETVYHNGILVREQSLDEIRELSNQF
jgi:nicotinamide phosphoribosyltransferase